ncbi:GMC oxidoreductase [Lentinula edodes]|uniref:GMC oxidoreductase n=1 Tax=Lentinula edodes TaxID=5353 RepID=UPI001E8D4DB6|nr:GMC oxidoreductase [Lentinula edodes]KAH7876389.1 GMC oxidoreductase [Lentinula edodes]
MSISDTVTATFSSKARCKPVKRNKLVPRWYWAMVSAESFCSTSFDYLILGGGTAGLVLAARLSEDPDVVVGVLEAGEHINEMPEISVPGMMGQALGNPKVDWAFSTVEQQAVLNRKIFSPRGKGVGGTSAINFLVYQRASEEDYNAIEALGNPYWNWKDTFLKYLMKVETYVPPTDPKIAKDPHIGYTTDYHGSSGPVKASFSAWFNDLHAKFMDTLVNMGVPINRDTGNGRNIGASVGPISVDPSTMTRSHAATAYYTPNSHRTNLVLLTGAHVTKILLDTPSGEPVVATGVEFLKDSQKFSVRAKVEIILAAGAFQTPQILELSGIGKTDIFLSEKTFVRTIWFLQSAAPIKSNSVTEDHLTLPFIHEVPEGSETFDSLRDPAFLEQQSTLYKNERKGLLAGSITAYGYLPSEKLFDSDGLTALQNQMLQDTTLTASPSLSKQSVLIKKWFPDPNQAQIEVLQFPFFLSFGPLPERREGKVYHSIMIIGLHPLSRGSVHISSADPLFPPSIDPRYFSNPADLEIMVSAVKFVRKLMRTEPYASAGCKMYDPPEKSAVSNEDLSDDEIRDWCRSRVISIFHPIGTAAMMPKEDGGVVDSSLKVYGTKNLRVARIFCFLPAVDASVIPLEMSTHPQAAVYAIAEKASDIIKTARAR